MSKIAGANSSPDYTHSFAIPATATGVIKAIANDNTSFWGGSEAIFIKRLWIDVTTVAAGATCTIDAGVGDSATDVADARSDDILDGIDFGSGTSLAGTVVDSFTLDLAGATAIMTPIKVPVDDYFLLHVKTGDATGVTGTVYIEWTYA